MRALRTCLGAMAMVLAIPTCAHALPGDPPITAISPADGATVAANAEGIPVTYSCPEYRDNELGFRGGAEDYRVRFSKSATVGGRGLLEGDLLDSGAAAVVGSDGVTCTSLLKTGGTSRSPEIVGGRVFWQPNRDCGGCEEGRPETGPVRSFVVRSTITGELKAPSRTYAGYLGVFALETKAQLSGATVALERRQGQRWKTVLTEAFRLDRTDLVASLPAGRQTIRAVVIAGGSRIQVATKTLTVRRAGRRSTSRRDDGRYAARPKPANSQLSFTVSGGGRTLRAFKASVPVFCNDPQQADFDRGVRTFFPRLGPVRVAPDGAVVGILRTKAGGRQLLTGRLRGGRLTGKLFVSLARCTGTRSFTAVRG